MIDTGDREPLPLVPLHALSGDIAFLAPPREAVPPKPGNFLSELLQRVGVVRYAVIPIVAQNHRLEPSTLYRDGEMPSPPKLALDLSQLGAKALRHGTPFHLKASRSGLPTEVREAQKGKAFRFAQTALAPPLLSEATELTQDGFLWIQLQAKLGKPLPQSRLKLLGFMTLLKAHHDIVNVADQADIALCMTSTPLVSPEIKHIIQIDVRRQG